MPKKICFMLLTIFFSFFLYSFCYCDTSSVLDDLYSQNTLPTSQDIENFILGDEYSSSSADDLVKVLNSGTNSKEGENILSFNDTTSKNTGLIMDDANLLNERQENALKEIMTKFLPYGNCLFVSYPRNTSYLSNMSTEDRARHYADKYLKDNGTVFLIDMKNREIYMDSVGKMRKTLTNRNAVTITDNTYSYATYGDYYKCSLESFSQAIDLLEGRRIAQPLRYVTVILFGLFCGFILNFFLVKFSREKNKKKLMQTFAATAAISTVAGATIFKYKKQHENSSGGFFGRSGGGGGFSGGGGFHSGGGHRF